MRFNFSYHCQKERILTNSQKNIHTLLRLISRHYNQHRLNHMKITPDKKDNH